MGWCTQWHHIVVNESIEFESRLNLELVSEEEIPMIKAFLKKEVGMDDTTETKERSKRNAFKWRSIFSENEIEALCELIAPFL